MALGDKSWPMVDARTPPPRRDGAMRVRACVCVDVACFFLPGHFQHAAAVCRVIAGSGFVVRVLSPAALHRLVRSGEGGSAEGAALGTDRALPSVNEF